MMFEVGKVYNRRDEIHKVYGGQQQGGISTPAKHPFVFIFTSVSGESYGYDDKFQSDGTFWYTGEGQVGDMRMSKGNLAIKEHQERGKRLFLFEYVKVAHVRLVGEAVYLDHHIEQRRDKNGDFRNAFIFHLALIAPNVSGEMRESRTEYKLSSKGLKSKSLEELRKIALTTTPKSSTKKEIRTSVAVRSEAIKIYVLKRANGICEGCGNDAPFQAKNGPYLEVHHINRVADGGPDHPANAIALCPNCHRQVHFGLDGEEYNDQLRAKLKHMEEE